MAVSAAALLGIIGLLCGASVVAGEGEGDKWAVLVAGSSGFWNYRHQADVCHAHQILRAAGFPDDRVIVMRYDDVAQNALNPMPGVVVNRAGCLPTERDASTGEWDVREGCNVEVGCGRDYYGAAVSPESFINVLRGDVSAQRLFCEKINSDPTRFGGCEPKVLNSTARDRVFVAFFDHGGTHMLGFPPAWKYGAMRYVTAKDLRVAMEHMRSVDLYGELVLYIEACESGSMFNDILPQNVSAFAVTAADPFHSSYASDCGLRLGGVTMPCLGDLFSVNWMRDVTRPGHMKYETLEEDFDIVEEQTNLSQVCAYGNESMASEHISSYLEYPTKPAGPRRAALRRHSSPRSGAAVPSLEAADAFLAASAIPELREELLARKRLREVAEANLAELAAVLDVPQARGLHDIHDKSICHKKPDPSFADGAAGDDFFDCLRSTIDRFQDVCGILTAEDLTRSSSVFSRLCAARTAAQIERAMGTVCAPASV